jgi:hypothetical protein
MALAGDAASSAGTLPPAQDVYLIFLLNFFLARRLARVLPGQT